VETYPKIELHVHLEATLRPERLLEIARRNDYPLPVDTVEGSEVSIDFATSITSSRCGSS
jgi:aminodeoxyfutalosine deaminase